jgi:hypothetical protein
MTVVRDPLDGSNAFCVESRGMTSLGATTPRARHVPRGGGEDFVWKLWEPLQVGLDRHQHTSHRHTTPHPHPHRNQLPRDLGCVTPAPHFLEKRRQEMTDVHLSHKWRSVQETPKHWPPRPRPSPFPTTPPSLQSVLGPPDSQSSSLELAAAAAAQAVPESVACPSIWSWQQMLGWAQDARAQMTMVVSSAGEGLVWTALGVGMLCGMPWPV